MFTTSCARRASSYRTSNAFIRHAIKQRRTHTTQATQGLSRGQIIASVGASVVAFSLLTASTVYAEQIPESDPTPVFEKERRQPKSKEDNRDIISSQHLQVKKSWENPGVYAWGTNAGRVVAPDSDDKLVKTARRIPFFDGVLLKDVKLDRTFGAAIDQKGDLLQWGTGFAPNCRAPERTLQGKNLKSLTISRDRVLALAEDGNVYSIPASQDEQQNGPKVSESSWLPFSSYDSNISYRNLTPKNLVSREKISAISGGLEHVLLLTSNGRVYSAAAGSSDFPRHGQMGVPGLTWATRPQGAYDQPHEIMTLHGFNITSIATGDYHSLASDKEGRVFAFGDNSVGQLGLDFNTESSLIDVPSLLPIQQLYAGSSQVPKVTKVAAGGSNSYFTIDAARVASPADADPASPARRLGRVTSDTWACGQGIWGNLANGRWTHVQSSPVKIPSLSGLYEYDEVNNIPIPIRLQHLAVGQTHSAAVMKNVTYLDASHGSGENDTNWGADIVFWGNNEYYQLGTGKRNNVSNPVYIQPLDKAAEDSVVKGRGKEAHRFQITPVKRLKVGGRSVDLEQRVECGRGCTAVYSGV